MTSPTMQRTTSTVTKRLQGGLPDPEGLRAGAETIVSTFKVQTLEVHLRTFKFKDILDL